MDSIKSPSDIGRIPWKIETGFAGFTADQFKNWTIFFSIPCLKGILPNDDLECWRHFVLACRIMCQHSLSVADISLADALLAQFFVDALTIREEYNYTKYAHALSL